MQSNNKPPRLFVTNTDIATLLDCSYSMAGKHKLIIYPTLNKEPGSKLTIDDLCEYLGIKLEQALRRLPEFTPIYTDNA